MAVGSEPERVAARVTLVIPTVMAAMLDITAQAAEA
jgi:hypothetical protein